MNILLDPKAMDQIQTLVSDKLGFKFDDQTYHRLINAVSDRMKSSSCDSLSAYWDRLQSPFTSRSELESLAQALTIGETYFFRHMDQYVGLNEYALPHLFEGTFSCSLNILSAGCSTGEEVYSIAITTKEKFPNCQINVFGLDLDPRSIEKAREGKYSEWSLRATSPALRNKYFHSNDGYFFVNSDIKTRVTFAVGNILIPGLGLSGEKTFDVIFCRNVLIYFSHEARKKAIHNFSNCLQPNGFLFLGASETLRDLSNEFTLKNSHNSFFYSKKPKAKANPTPPLLIETLAHRELSAETTLTRSKPQPTQVVEYPLRYIAPPHENQAKLHIPTVLSLMEREQYKDAFESINTLPPHLLSIEHTFIKAILLTHLGNIALAKSISLDLVQAHNLNSDFHFLLALCLEQLHEDGPAIYHNRVSIYLEPDFSIPHFHLGTLLKRNKEFKSALRAFTKALELLPKESSKRILFFGCGFQREALSNFCKYELRTLQRAS